MNHPNEIKWHWPNKQCTQSPHSNFVHSFVPCWIQSVSSLFFEDEVKFVFWNTLSKKSKSELFYATIGNDRGFLVRILRAGYWRNQSESLSTTQQQSILKLEREKALNPKFVFWHRLHTHLLIWNSHRHQLNRRIWVTRLYEFRKTMPLHHVA